MPVLTLRCHRGRVLALLIATSALAVSISQAGPPSRQDEARSARRAASHERVNYAWPFSTGPFYGEVGRGHRQARGVIRTSVGSFRLGVGDLGIPEELRAPNKLGQLESQYFILQLDPRAAASGSARELREAIESNGGTVAKSLPVSAVIARLNQAAFDAVGAIPGLAALEPYHPAFKLEPTIGRRPLRDPVKALSAVYELNIRLFRGEDPDEVAQAVTELGGTVLAVWPDMVRAEIHSSKLSAIASLEPVFMIYEHLPIRPHGEETTTAIQTGRWNSGATPYHDAGIDGGGSGLASAQVLMVLDSGIQLDAADLSDTRVAAGTAGGGHRKVLVYQTTTAFGGSGDLLGCDSPTQGGFTHGHVVAATALGNATDVDPGYGSPWLTLDLNGNPWKLDGVAPRALLVAYDAQQTPVIAACDDPLKNTLLPGDLYSGGAIGSLGEAYTNHDARIFNFSWGADANVYDSNAMDIDDFLVDKGDALVFVSAGNTGADVAPPFGEPDEATLQRPATAKNAVPVGASGGPDNLGGSSAEENRAEFSGMGPAPGGRIAPLLMAPGQELGSMGVDSEFACRSSDNEQSDPVECDQISGLSGTSYASAAAAGAALLVRDYFAQGFYPDATSRNPGNAGDQVSNISGALVKSILIVSADFMTGTNLTHAFRFNNQQGYGRIQLDNALPLDNWPGSVTGLIVADGGIPGGPNNLGLDGVVDATIGETDSATFEVCDDAQELRVALSWLEESGQVLLNDLDLELESPSGTVVYRGNYFTDDDDRDGAVDSVTEDCPDIRGNPGTVDSSQWSLPICMRGDASLSPHDFQNPTEVVMLSPDYDGDAGSDLDPVDDNQLELGTWTIRVTAKSGGSNPVQRYAVAISGGTCLGSSLRLSSESYPCNSASATVTVNEIDEGSDPAAGLTAAEISSRVSVEVVADVCDDLETTCATAANCTGIGSGDCNLDLIVDVEANVSFTQDALTFASDPVVLSDLTARDPGNGVMDVRHGDRLRLVYDDESNGTPDPDLQRTTIATIECQANIGFGRVAFAQFGMDASYLVVGGCETDARGGFDFGFPDRYIDAGETVEYVFGFVNQDEELENVEVSLRCVEVDGDSPESCLPSSLDCGDPRRENNPICPQLTIVDAQQIIDLLVPGEAVAVNFLVEAAPVIAGTPEIEMVLDIASETSGKFISAVGVNRHTLDVDELSVFFSTDFPTGGTEVVDWNNNELVEDPTTDPGNLLTDYRFETRTWGDLTAAGTKNGSLRSPWNFDSSDGGFTSGLAAMADFLPVTDIIAQWGEDLNFNGTMDRRCENNPGQPCLLSSTDCLPFGWGECITIEDRDPFNGVLDQNWSTLGGCGWQTRAPGTCSLDSTLGCHSDTDCALVGLGSCTGPAQPTGGAWHTGRIGDTTSGVCLTQGDTTGQCQAFEVLSGDRGQLIWSELLLTPLIEKANGAGHRVEILGWEWNQSIDLPDDNAALTWEFDTDVASLLPVDLIADNAYPQALFGPYGVVTDAGDFEQTGGFPVFAPIDPATGSSLNGVLGSNREGQNACFFEVTGVDSEVLGLALPPDDDLNNGYCPFDPNQSCSMVCDSDDTLRCNDDADCPVSCVATTPDCIDPLTPCVDDGGCTSFGGGTCVDTDDPADATPDTCQFQCLFDNTAIDEYVTVNGPIRNMGISAFGGPDMRFNTLEDMYGATGDTFQAALGFHVFEKVSPSDPDPQPGFGVSVDDMVIQWREYALVDDATDCSLAEGGGPPCVRPLVEIEGLPGGASELTIKVKTDNPPNNNDCNGDDDVNDPGDDMDCDNDFITDVVVRVTSLGVVGEGEIVVLNKDGNTNMYVGKISVSMFSDQNEKLFLQQWGELPPSITVAYKETVQCGWQTASTSFSPVHRNIVVVQTELVDDGDGDQWADTGEFVMMNIWVSNKTGKAIENVQARLVLRPANDDKIACYGGNSINVGHLDASSDPVRVAEAFTFTVADAPQGDRIAQGKTALDEFSATFQVVLFAMAGDKVVFTGTTVPQLVTLDLDLDAVNGGGAALFSEGFEGGLGPFVVHDIDSWLTSAKRADGYRCQYSDPDRPWTTPPHPPNPKIKRVCHFGAPHSTENFWNIDSSRAYAGTQSLYMGAHGTCSVTVAMACQSDADCPPTETCDYPETTLQAVLGAVETTTTINVGLGKFCSEGGNACADDGQCAGGDDACRPPELSFFHQISQVDERSWPALGDAQEQKGTSAGRGLVMVQPAEGHCSVTNILACDPHADCPGELCLTGRVCSTSGDPCDPDSDCPGNESCVDPWIKLYPYWNVYDRQASDSGTSKFLSDPNLNERVMNPVPRMCSWDPIDDSSNEDAFFPGEQEFETLGPSSTCYPEMSFASLGETGNPFAPGNVGNSSETGDDGTPLPGKEGVKGDGTWVESRFNLERFQGRQLRLRFLNSSMGPRPRSVKTWEQYLAGLNPGDSRDDGWWIDAVKVSGNLSTPVSLFADADPNSGAGDCDNICTTVVADLVSNRNPLLPAPGQRVRLDAEASSADACLNGVLEYRFWVDGDANGSAGDPTDWVLQTWSDSWETVVRPDEDTQYLVEVRCSEDASCNDTVALSMAVKCPGRLGPITAPDKTSFTWSSGPVDVDWVRGDFTAPSDIGAYAAVFQATLNNAMGISDSATPPSGTGRYYLVKKDGFASEQFCNSPNWGNAPRNNALGDPGP